jgi:hypothetical protein
MQESKCKAYRSLLVPTPSRRQHNFSPSILGHVETRRIQQMWIYQIVLDFRLRMVSEEKDEKKGFGTVFFSRDHAMMSIAAVMSAV